MWNKTQIQQHIQASKLLLKIKDWSFKLIQNNNSITEYEVQQFIKQKFRKLGITSSKDPPIVAFRKNTANVHYYPKRNSSQKIRIDSLIMIDIWARLNRPKAPFSDITWMAYKGNKVPKEIQQVFHVVMETRDKCINFIKKELKKGKIPVGKDISQVTIDNIKKRGFQGKMNHYTGHGLGNTSPHGNRQSLRSSNKHPIHYNYGYTIEPGIYLENKRGIRSEIDAYITKNKKLVITTNVQKRIELV